MEKNLRIIFSIYVIILFNGYFILSAQQVSAPIFSGDDGKLHYAIDKHGNQIPDFSFCGYMGGNRNIPDIPVRIRVPVVQGDATNLIQSAIDYVASLPADKYGIRGAVLLDKGTYGISGNLVIKASGVILRGSGMDDGGTILLAGGTDRRTLITITGKNDQRIIFSLKITDRYVPVNSFELRVNDSHSLKTGDRIFVHRPSTAEWIDFLGMKEFGGETAWIGWKPGTRDLLWDRIIVSIDKDLIKLNAPITTSLDQKYGGGTIERYDWNGRISQTGVENLCCVSEYDTSNQKDEYHSWMAITMENVENSWVRQVTFKHFAGSAVAVYETASRITVEDCKSLSPVSEIGGFRRNTFFTSGQQVLFQRCYAEYGDHDFSTGFCAAGPNAFVQCQSHRPYSYSGSIDSWSSGTLFDIVNIDGQALSFRNLGQDEQGAGWNTANSVFWQCTAARIDCFNPPSACNWACGTWAQFSGNGIWYEPNSHINPRSIYYAQLANRLGDSMLEKAYLLPVSTEASTSPTIEQAAEFIVNSVKPPLLLTDWIDQSSERNPIPINTEGIKTIYEVLSKKPETPKKQLHVAVQNGLLVCDGSMLTGSRHNVSWWRGNIRPYALKNATPHITRFVPGRTGTGLTDDLNQVVDWMTGNHMVALEHNYGLWYDRRRDDHERIRRLDGDVWPPFYELPFARSGLGTAWDGLSKYDLTKYNTWYWNRLKQFAELADQNGVLLIHQNYFQHNILEAGAHWADFPWRSANNINHTGFPEPPPYAGDKRIFMAEQFYDVTNPVRREIHKAYIRKCLDNFKDETNVIQLTSAEYTGPLHFVQFWIDVITEWEKETGKNVLIGLSATKDVQDSILADPVRSKTIDVIDIRYWHYRKDGSAYAPEGGKNLAPRQHARLVKPGESSFDQVYRAVSEYRMNNPEKAVIYSATGRDKFAWAVFMAGGSIPELPEISDTVFLKDAAIMKPVNFFNAPKESYAIGKENLGIIIYCETGNSIEIDLTSFKGAYIIMKIDSKTGKVTDSHKRIKGGKIEKIESFDNQHPIIWLKKVSEY